jgi:hypothetical protein
VFLAPRISGACGRWADASDVIDGRRSGMGKGANGTPRRRSIRSSRRDVCKTRYYLPPTKNVLPPPFLWGGFWSADLKRDPKSRKRIVRTSLVAAPGPLARLRPRRRAPRHPPPLRWAPRRVYRQRSAYGRGLGPERVPSVDLGGPGPREPLRRHGAALLGADGPYAGAERVGCSRAP